MSFNFNDSAKSAALPHAHNNIVIYAVTPYEFSSKTSLLSLDRVVYLLSDGCNL